MCVKYCQKPQGETKDRDGFVFVVRWLSKIVNKVDLLKTVSCCIKQGGLFGILLVLCIWQLCHENKLINMTCINCFGLSPSLTVVGIDNT